MATPQGVCDRGGGGIEGVKNARRCNFFWGPGGIYSYHDLHCIVGKRLMMAGDPRQCQLFEPGAIGAE